MPAGSKIFRVTFFLGIVFCLAASHSVWGDDAHGNKGAGTRENPFIVPMSLSPMNIDGVLDEEAWERALILELKYEVEPGENVPAPIRTEVLIIYDSNKLYTAFRCYDPDPSAIRAHISDREDCFSDDHVNIHIDTFNDERRHLAFGGNPLGVQMDAIATGGSFDWSWDAIWDSAGKIYDWGYVLEMAIPFNQLRFQRSEGPQVWGFDAWRVQPRSVQRFLCVIPHDRNNNCFQCQMVKIKGFEGANPGRNVEVAPTLTAVRTDERSELPSGEFEKRNQKTDLGLTTRWGITPNITLSGALNPDFSQVEADAFQLDINQTFALYYHEKRPFFTEGADFFDTRLNVVYTRTMRDPIWGLKLTGKEGANTFGAYVVRDELTNIIFPGNQSSSSTSLALESTASVFRYKRDIGSKYTVGALFTDREGDDYFNRMLGFDGDFRFTGKDRLRVQALYSNTSYPGSVAEEFDQPLDGFGGAALDLFYVHNTRTWDFWGGFRDLGDDFRADIGFMPRVGYSRYYGGTGYNWIGNDKTWYTSLYLESNLSQDTDREGNLLQREANVFFQYQGPLQSHSFISIERTTERYSELEFDQNELYLHHCMSPNGDCHFGVNFLVGDRIDYANLRLGKRLRLSGNVGYNFGLHLRLSVNHVFERMRVSDARLYTANISRASVIYQFNTRTFFRSILQYVDYNYNVANYTFDIDPEFKHLFAQWLFSYKINPQTVLFIGYSDNYLGNQNFNLTQSDRTFFVKLGYAWVL